ncbi:hypothetical protein fHeYen902_093c [Yersinia phage fHe-Yen9-02]|nr:hypothetical protein fHeYen902_093c [Yersinia phage fHe-Yen9-02]
MPLDYMLLFWSVCCATTAYGLISPVFKLQQLAWSDSLIGSIIAPVVCTFFISNTDILIWMLVASMLIFTAAQLIYLYVISSVGWILRKLFVLDVGLAQAGMAYLCIKYI